MMTVPANQTRIGFVQALRGIAAMLVVLVHTVSSALMPQAGFPDQARPFAARVVDLGASGVDIFFVISGFIMAFVIGSDRVPGATRFLMDRFLRVVPYYWLATLMFLAVVLAGGREYLDLQLIISATVFPVPHDGSYETPLLLVGWTLAFEVAFYGVVALAVAIGSNAIRRVQIAMAAACMLGTLGLLQVPENDFLAVWRNPLWFEFLLGMLVFCGWRACPRPSSPIWGPVLLVGGILGLMATLTDAFQIDETARAAYDHMQGPARLLAWGLPGAAILLGGLWSSARSGSGANTRLDRGLLAIGDASYSLYLLHLPVICLYEDLVPAGTLPWFVVVPLLSALSLVVALGAYRWVERPMLAWLRRIVLPVARPATSLAQT